MTHICELFPSGEPAESARELLERHGLPEDVVDGALALHAQELAAVQRREAAVWGVDTAAGKHILGAADLIDPTRGALPAAVPVPPPADQTALRDRIAAAMREHYLCTNREEADADGNLPCRCGDWREPGAEVDDENDWDSHLADAVLAVLPEQADRGADTFAAIRPQTLTALASHIDARSVAILRPESQTYAEWQTMAALLRRVAAEEQPAETQARPPCPDPIECGHEAALGLAEMRLDKIREKATEWTALAPPDDWGNTPQDTALADVGRYLLRLIETTPPTERPAVGEQPETQEADRG